MWTLKSLFKHCNEVQTELKTGEWVPAKPIPYRPIRQSLKEAWYVLAGKADCFVWPEDEQT